MLRADGPTGGPTIGSGLEWSSDTDHLVESVFHRSRQLVAVANVDIRSDTRNVVLCRHTCGRRIGNMDTTNLLQLHHLGKNVAPTGVPFRSRASSAQHSRLARGQCRK